MKRVAYASPFVPPEWLAAHGVRPVWMQPTEATGGPRAALRRGVCPFAGSVIDAVLGGDGVAAVVLATSCDQMRYAAALLARDADIPVFLMNVPSTWQTLTAADLYVDELRRLGGFLERLGGRRPDGQTLARMMQDYGRSRSQLLAARSRLSPREFAEAVVRLRGELESNGYELDNRVEGTVRTLSDRPEAGIPLALLGGPMMAQGVVVYDLLEEAGGRVVLDASESGERTLPATFDPGRLAEDPFGELARAYFDHIPDVFRRPNQPLYEWFGEQIRSRGVRGIVLRRYVWCDLWHAELGRLCRWSPLPVLDLDLERVENPRDGRMLGRLEAFLEVLS